ncbi:MAG: general stress protein [Chitinophagaceae bacterium]|nr:MAG: general stress protein [Chitinophagaceae bacterium]
MDSINANQQEDNFKNLFGPEAIEKVRDLAKKSGGCFFCTHIETGQPFATRPMAPEKIDDDGNFWFLSSDDSNKNRELKSDSHAQLLFQGSSYSDFLSLYGTVQVSRDKQKIDELWDAQMKTWFTEGKDDPRITVLQFIPTEGYYWDTKHAMPVAFVKRLVGAAIGKTMDDSIEGNIKL